MFEGPDMGIGLSTTGNIIDPQFFSAQFLKGIEQQNITIINQNATIINQNNEIIMLLKAINYKMPKNTTEG